MRGYVILMGIMALMMMIWDSKAEMRSELNSILNNIVDGSRKKRQAITLSGCVLVCRQPWLDLINKRYIYYGTIGVDSTFRYICIATQRFQKCLGTCPIRAHWQQKYWEEKTMEIMDICFENHILPQLKKELNRPLYVLYRYLTTTPKTPESSEYYDLEGDGDYSVEDSKEKSKSSEFEIISTKSPDEFNEYSLEESPERPDKKETKPPTVNKGPDTQEGAIITSPLSSTIRTTTRTTPTPLTTTTLPKLSETLSPGAPTSFDVKARQNSVRVTWRPPADQDILVRGYVLGWGLDIPDVNQIQLPASSRSYTIDGLKPGEEYVISLRAKNHVGNGFPLFQTVRIPEETSELEVVTEKPTTYGVDASTKCAEECQNLVEPLAGQYTECVLIFASNDCLTKCEPSQLKSEIMSQNELENKKHGCDEDFLLRDAEMYAHQTH